jgi:hypothetical protein
VVDITTVWDAKIGMLHAHTSQFYEWLPYNGGHVDEVPGGDQARRAWLSERMARQAERLAERCRSRLVEVYGHNLGSTIRLVEAFEACEYGAPLDSEAIARLFPFATPRPG